MSRIPFIGGGERDELLTVAELAEELKISRRTFYRWRELRTAPASIRLPNGEIRVPRRELTAWLDQLGERAA
jgi:excisionase family DNA binding protein